MKIKLKKKYVIWFWVGTAHSATPDEPPLNISYLIDVKPERLLLGTY
jgi:hypothetical protein